MAIVLGMRSRRGSSVNLRQCKFKLQSPSRSRDVEANLKEKERKTRSVSTVARRDIGAASARSRAIRRWSVSTVVRLDMPARTVLSRRSLAPHHLVKGKGKSKGRGKGKKSKGKGKGRKSGRPSAKPVDADDEGEEDEGEYEGEEEEEYEEEEEQDEDQQPSDDPQVDYIAVSSVGTWSPGDATFSSPQISMCMTRNDGMVDLRRVALESAPPSTSILLRMLHRGLLRVPFGTHVQYQAYGTLGDALMRFVVLERLSHFPSITPHELTRASTAAICAENQVRCMTELGLTAECASWRWFVNSHPRQLDRQADQFEAFFYFLHVNRHVPEAASLFETISSDLYDAAMHWLMNTRYTESEMRTPSLSPRSSAPPAAPAAQEEVESVSSSNVSSPCPWRYNSEGHARSQASESGSPDDGVGD